MERRRDRGGEGQKEQVVRREGLMSNERLTRPQLILSLYLCFGASLSTKLMDRLAKHRANFSPHDKYLLLNHLDKLASKSKLIVDSIFRPLYRFKAAMILRSQRLISVTAALDPSAYCETPVYNPDLCPNMIAAQAKLVYHLNKYYNEKCQSRKAAISKTIREVCKVVSDVLKEVEVQEPRFISSLSEMDNRFEGLEVISPTEFEVVLYLNQMGVFNFVDDGSLPGCAVLKLSDGRKRSMSLWVEFITASGYLSARKIRSRFQTLVAQAVDKCSYRDVVKMVADTSEVKLRIRDRYVVQITPAFKCTGIWPRSAAHWPLPHIPWPGPNRVAEVKAEGFNLLSKECYSLNGKQSSAESDAWVLQFAEAENRLLLGGCRKKCLSVLKALRDRHLELPGQPLNNYHMKTLVSYECEKHPRESDWDENCLGDRLNGILLQLISCLQCRRCPHYFLPNLDLFQGKPHSALENAAKQTWRLAREILTNPKSLEKL
ncbi:putative nucleotidyltransferase MAB21L1 [Collichthys lucidus]|uniref:Putative nucleotidyltransferase MAB21L1 n=1 Tax=Collichthys lucidus TaxID=240159 RepID=A0A4U5UZH0_COLLU|nr:putative nucleotidyltransferase MAB21L1 [Collichthys lucidus]